MLFRDKNNGRQTGRLSNVADNQHNPHLIPLSTVESHPAKRHQRLNGWLKRHEKKVLIVLAVVLLSGGGLAYWWLGTGSLGGGEAFKPTKIERKFYSPLTGVQVGESETKLPVTAVMIENSPEARPQSGIKEAGVVFESVAEAGITRFLTLYQEAQPGLIGPVRSVRSQFASWAAAFDGGLAHVGGAPEPLIKLRSGQIKDLDQFFNAGAFYRAGDRFAPHNVYTTADRLRGLNQSKNYSTSNFTAWKRPKKEALSPTPNARTISVPTSSGIFNSSYNWDQASNSYVRLQGGAVHSDREKGQITPKVVLVLQVPHDVISGGNGYRYPNVVGSGRAWLFQNGIVAEVTWTKASDKDQLLFKDAAGADVELNRGQAWITAISPDRAPSWQ